MNEKQIKWFYNELNNRNKKIFFNRFERIYGQLDFKDKDVLDFGCGCGALGLETVLNRGAKSLTGIDLHSEWIKFANENLEVNYSQYKNNVSFFNCDIDSLPENMKYDIIISKEVFEHVDDLASAIKSMKSRLRNGGMIVSGFGPLYNSPMGHHKRFTYQFPFAHIFLNERYLFKKLNEIKMDNKYKNLNDLGLNGLSFKKYKEILLKGHDLEVIFFETNVNERFINILFKFLSKIPFLNEYFTHNIYIILLKK
jgi:SAM-dependent methyltransferase